MSKPVSIQELFGEKNRRKIIDVRRKIRTGKYPDDYLVNSEKVVRKLLKEIREG